VPAEIELKLAIDPSAVAATLATLPRHPALASVRKGRWRTATVQSTYLDTPDWQLAEAGLALRVRRDGVRWLQTVKGPPLADAGGALHARSEYEWPIAGPELDPARLATTPWRALLGRAIAARRLAARFTTEFERRTLHLAWPDGTRAALCIDVGEIRIAGRRRRGAPGGARRVPIAEIEIELASGNAANLFALAHALAVDLPISVSTANKAMRGQALVLGRPDGYASPVHAGPVALAGGIATGAALQAIALECIQQIAANAPGLLADDDPEWVHQMRIGTRRLRSCLGLAVKVVPAESLAPLVDDVKWLATTLGNARDLDVFATETVPKFAARYAAETESTTDLLRLRARIAARRRAARAAAREAVGSRRFQQLVLAAGAWCAAPGCGAPTNDGARVDARAKPATKFARHVLERRHHRLLERAEASTNGSAAARHRLRIAAKKLRYAAEFFAPLAQAKRSDPYVKALAGLQDLLGLANDAVTAERLIGEIAHADDHAVAAALRGWAASRGAAVLPEIKTALERFDAVRRFWKKR
jgi:inorganic triphosphatase YgiF